MFMFKYTSRVTLYLDNELSKDDIANLEDCLETAIFEFSRKYNIPFSCLSFID